MRLSADSIEANIIRSFRPGEIYLRDSIVRANIIITAEQIIHDWHAGAPADLSITDLQPALDMQPEILLLGTGVRQQFPPISVLTQIMQSGIAVEVMDTRAACSTFNILVGEQRGVVAALLVE